MDRLLFVSMTGARETLNAQAIASHNLANASTTGFRADLAAQRSQPVFGDGLPTRVFAMTERSGIDFGQGFITATGRELDVAVDGMGFLAVQHPDGQPAYTRDGRLKVSAAGLLSTHNGRPVLGEGGPITVPPGQRIEIGVDGSVVAYAAADAQNANVVGRLLLVKPQNPDLNAVMTKTPEGLLRTRDGTPLPPDATVKLQPMALEGSNVDAVGSLVDMLSLARQFEMQVKMMNLANENAQSAHRLLRIS